MAAVYSAFKDFKANPVRATRGRSGGDVFGFYVKLEDLLDQLIAVFDSEKEIEAERDHQR